MYSRLRSLVLCTVLAMSAAQSWGSAAGLVRRASQTCISCFSSAKTRFFQSPWEDQLLITCMLGLMTYGFASLCSSDEVAGGSSQSNDNPPLVDTTSGKLFQAYTDLQTNSSKYNSNLEELSKKFSEAAVALGKHRKYFKDAFSASQAEGKKIAKAVEAEAADVEFDGVGRLVCALEKHCQRFARMCERFQSSKEIANVTSAELQMTHNVIVSIPTLQIVYRDLQYWVDELNYAHTCESPEYLGFIIKSMLETKASLTDLQGRVQFLIGSWLTVAITHTEIELQTFRKLPLAVNRWSHAFRFGDEGEIIICHPADRCRAERYRNGFQ